MDNKKVNRILRQRAIDLGLCKQWQGQWKKDWPEEKMISKYKEGIDFCLANDYPSNEFIKENFSKEALVKGGLFVDMKRSVQNMLRVVAKGTSEVTARYDGDTIGEIYAADNAIIHVYARNNSHVIVHMLGKAAVTAEQFDKATLLVIRHSMESSIITTGNTRTKTELDWLK